MKSFPTAALNDPEVDQGGSGVILFVLGWVKVVFGGSRWSGLFLMWFWGVLDGSRLVLSGFGYALAGSCWFQVVLGGSDGRFKWSETY